MFIVYHRNNMNQGKIIRPTPFVSISYNMNRNKEGVTGGSYDITLTGVILANAGSPLADSDAADILSVGPNYENNFRGDYTRPNKQPIVMKDRAHSIFLKQQAIRGLFAHDGQKMEFSSIRNDEPIIKFYPTVESINFEEGIYTNLCRYTIVLNAPVLFNNDDKPLDAASTFYTGTQENKTYHIDDFSDTWSIELDDSFGRTLNNNPIVTPRSYKVSRTVSATGRTMYFPNGNRYEAWEQAKKFVRYNILNENVSSPANQPKVTQFPTFVKDSKFASKLLDIPTNFKGVSEGFNHIRSENIDKTAGTYSLTDSWILTELDDDNIPALENYNISTNSSTGSPYVTVSIDGNIKGLSDSRTKSNIYTAALNKFNAISRNQTWDTNNVLYKRANSTTIKPLNVIPTSISITSNELSGELSYNITYDNRPSNGYQNFFSQEKITINDTYPGDVYSLIPVINNLTGPLFQYIGGRTEYRRDLTIEFVVNKSLLSNRINLKGKSIYKNPSTNPQIKGIINNIVLSASPAQEPGIYKYFLNPVSENWDPKTGQYSVQISWTYEFFRGF